MRWSFHHVGKRVSGTPNLHVLIFLHCQFELYTVHPTNSDEWITRPFTQLEFIDWSVILTTLAVTFGIVLLRFND